MSGLPPPKKVDSYQVDKRVSLLERARRYTGQHEPP